MPLTITHSYELWNGNQQSASICIARLLLRQTCAHSRCNAKKNTNINENMYIYINVFLFWVQLSSGHYTIYTICAIARKWYLYKYTLTPLCTARRWNKTDVRPSPNIYECPLFGASVAVYCGYFREFLFTHAGTPYTHMHIRGETKQTEQVVDFGFWVYNESTRRAMWLLAPAVYSKQIATRFVAMRNVKRAFLPIHMRMCVFVCVCFWLRWMNGKCSKSSPSR